MQAQGVGICSSNCRLCVAQTLDCAGKHQVLIFVHSRKETAKTARYLKEEALREDRLAQFMKVLHFSLLMQFLS